MQAHLETTSTGIIERRNDGPRLGVPGASLADRAVPETGGTTVVPGRGTVRLTKFVRGCPTAMFVAVIAAPQGLLACATCFGKSDSNLARGMNWGIFSLLAVVVFVLGCIAAFFIYLARRAAASSSVEPETARVRAGILQTALSHDQHI